MHGWTDGRTDGEASRFTLNFEMYTSQVGTRKSKAAAHLFMAVMYDAAQMMRSKGWVSGNGLKNANEFQVCFGKKS